MRLKHVLFGGLLLTVGFAACTNEDFTELQAPSTGDVKGISLGENYTITGVKAENPETKMIFEVADGALKPYWEQTDIVGAAIYNYIGEGGIGEDGLVDENATIGAANATYKFASNINFNWLENVGDKYTARFQANTNAMAGAYVMYYPYNPEVTTYSNAIPVEMEFPTTFDCKDQFAEVSKRIFAYGESAFVPGGEQTGYFQLRQVPVIFRLNFGAEKLNIVNLSKTLTIDKVIFEAKDASGNSVLVTKGNITPNTTLTYTDYNNYLAYVEDNTKGAKLPEAVYEGDDDSSVGHYTIDVENGDNADYQISELDKASEGSIIFSALPFTEDATSVTIKIVTTEGEVYSKEYTGTDNELKVFNDNATEEGGLVQLDVMLDTQSTENTIYTADQFKAQWEAALESNEPVTLTIADPVILEDLALEIPESSKADITIESEDGAALTVGSINLKGGKLTIDSDVTVEGEIYNLDSELNINGKLTAKDAASIYGTAKLDFAEMTSLYIGNNAEATVTLPDDAKKGGAITINGGKLTLNGGSLSNITNNNGTLELAGDITNTGVFEGTVTGKGKFINAKGATATFTGTITVLVENEEGATLNIDATKVTLSNGSSNAGTINVKAGKLVATNSGFAQEATGKIYVEEDAMVNLKNNTISGWVVMNHKDATVKNVSNNNVAFSAKSVDDLGNMPNASTANYVFIDKDLKIESEINVHRHIHFNANIELVKSATLTCTWAAYVNGDRTFSGEGTVTISNDSSSTLTINGSLTLTKDVHLNVYKMTQANINKITAVDYGKQVTVTKVE